MMTQIKKGYSILIDHNLKVYISADSSVMRIT